MSAPETASNWDLTPVLNLLHTFQPDGQPCSSDPCVPTKHSLPKDPALQDASDNARDVCGHRRLGDFTAVLDYLSNTPSFRHDGASTKKGIRLDVLGDPLSKQNDEKSDAVSDNKGTRITNDKKILLRRPPKASEETKPADDAVVPAPKVVLLARPKSPGDSKTKTPSSPKKSSSLLEKRSSDEAASFTTPSCSKNLLSASKSRNRVESVLPGTAEQKKVELISKLRERCPNERKCFANPKLPDPAFTLSNTSSKGIHVFIDISNIMVGFHDVIKSARHIPLTCRVPRLPLSFHNFSLVLERGRSVSKRVLVGSDRFPAIDEAERLGYETNILERVQKVKDTPRKKNFTTGDKSHDQSSGSETNARTQLQRWVEQAVDEIIHLKMLESIVDTAEPSTIVLATGDAAEAEYSGGFMRMVERALEKGWRVELVSFNSTTSRAYSRKDFRAKWSSRFVLIQLDVYAEYLLDMHA